MFVEPTMACRSGTPQTLGSPEAWKRRAVRSTRDIDAAIRPILNALGAAGYTRKETFGVRMALEEALVNAVLHGHHDDPTKRVRLRYHVNEERFLAEVEDEGAGFDPYQAPDPFAPENQDRDGGRGLFLIRHYMTSVRHNAAGNCLTLCKQRGKM